MGAPLLEWEDLADSLSLVAMTNESIPSETHVNIRSDLKVALPKLSDIEKRGKLHHYVVPNITWIMKITTYRQMQGRLYFILLQILGFI